MSRAAVLTIILWGTSVLAQDRRVCITIDDLPCTNCAEGTWSEVTDGILDALEKHKVPGIGFVNEGKLYRDGVLDEARLALLEQWLQRGQDLGNHTFGHKGTDNQNVAQYEQDIVEGEQLLRPLIEEHGHELRYFRHPFLRTGPTPAYRDSLNAVIARHGYTVAPVTFDNDEYIHAFCYEHAKRRGDKELMVSLAANYLAYMDSIIRFHEVQTNEFLGREIPHVLLIHANALNADHLDPLLDMLEERGYRFVTLEEALKDPAYALPESSTRYGFSWIRRWRLAAGQHPPWPPEVDTAVMKRYNALRKR